MHGKYPLDQRQHVAQSIDISDGAYRKKFLDFMHKDSPHKSSPDGNTSKIMETMSQRSFEAQAVRDDTMAESIARHLKNHPKRQVLHLNVDFHSSEFLGTVERLQQRMPQLKIAVIHTMTERHEKTIDPSRPPGTVLIKVQSIPDKFVKAENRDQWLRKVMKKRMDSRKNCPE